LEDTVFCKAMCGNNIHKECFNQWARIKRQEGSEITCGIPLPFGIELTVVYCRTRWDDGKGTSKGGDEAGEEGYLNLGKMIGASPVRGYHTIWNMGTNDRYIDVSL